VHLLTYLILVLTCIPRATVSAVFCLVVPAFICIDLLISRVLKMNDDDDDDDKLHSCYEVIKPAISPKP